MHSVSPAKLRRSRAHMKLRKRVEARKLQKLGRTWDF